MLGVTDHAGAMELVAAIQQFGAELAIRSEHAHAGVVALLSLAAEAKAFALGNRRQADCTSRQLMRLQGLGHHKDEGRLAMSEQRVSERASNNDKRERCTARRARST